jgi:hypothetical protein
VVSRCIDEPITVHVNRESVPTAFIWRRRLYRVVETLSCWREASEWWNGEPVRVLIRVTAERRGAGIYELCRSGTSWFMHRVLD